MPRRTEPRQFVAIDGEAIDGKYAMMAWHDGKRKCALWSKTGEELSTLECLDFLIDTKRANPGATFVCFGLNYDANMIVRDLNREQLQTLWNEGEIWLSMRGARYRLRWIPRKMFQVYSKDEQVRVTVYDCFGFFQSSFVKALEAWKIPDRNGEIKSMKQERARFEWSQKDEIERYCFAECKQLVTLMDALEGAMRQAGIKLRSYMGAGSVASAIMQHEKVKAHRVSDRDWPDDVRRAIFRAYFGGRVEVFLQGVMTNVVNYDIVSAYPHQALALPSLVNGRWREAEPEDLARGGLNAIWRVRWDVNESRHVMPFPLRRKGMIYYPANGSGWYHHAEVRAALALMEAQTGARQLSLTGDEECDVLEGWVFEPADDVKPFAFIRDYFAMRAEAKARGEASEKAYKLGLNSIYGKLAQGISYNGEPPFRSLYWAGRITAGTRARLLDAATLHPHGVVSMSTDGIVFSGDPGIEESKVLGGWERTEIDELFIAQPGIYLMVKHDGSMVRKSRGFFTREIDYEDLRDGWTRYGASYTQQAVCECGHVHGESGCYRCDCTTFSRRRRFVGIGAALMRSDFSVWRTWQESDRVLSLQSSRKFYAHNGHGRVARLTPPRFTTTYESEPYVPKTKTLEDREEMLELVQGMEQPLTTND